MTPLFNPFVTLVRAFVALIIHKNVTNWSHKCNQCYDLLQCYFCSLSCCILAKNYDL